MNPETTPTRGKGDSATANDTNNPNHTMQDEASQRWRCTALAAFYRAEARGFAPGGELDDWLAAEQALNETSDAPSNAVSAAEPAPVPAQSKASARKREAAKSGPRARKTEHRMVKDIGSMA